MCADYKKSICEPIWRMDVINYATSYVKSKLLNHYVIFLAGIGLNRISARYNITNPRSGGVMINVGMSKECVLKIASQTGCNVVI